MKTCDRCGGHVTDREAVSVAFPHVCLLEDVAHHADARAKALEVRATAVEARARTLESQMAAYASLLRRIVDEHATITKSNCPACGAEYLTHTSTCPLMMKKEENPA